MAALITQPTKTSTPKTRPRRDRKRPITAIMALLLCAATGWLIRSHAPFAHHTPPPPDLPSFLKSASILPTATGFSFLQLPINPAHQRRWIQSLDLEPITQPVRIPTLSTARQWSQHPHPHPPYAWEVVDQWWDLHGQTTQHAFVARWPDGSFLLLDLQSDHLYGYLHRTHFSSLASP